MLVTQAPLMVAILSLMNPLGTMVGFVLPYAFVSQDDSVERQREQFRSFMVSQAALAGGLLLLVMAVMQSKQGRAKPEPSSIASGHNTSAAVTAYESLANQEKYSALNRLVHGGNTQPGLANRISVYDQYKLLFRDRCYVFMMLAGSHIFGVMGAVGGTIVQEVTIWGQSEVGLFDQNLGSVLAAVCVVVGLVSSIIGSLTLMKLKSQFCVFCSLQLVSALGIATSYAGLFFSSIPILVVGTLLYATFTFPSFPVMMELIGKRVGKEMDLVATGNVFFLTQVVTSLLLAAVGFILNTESKANSTYSFVLIFALISCTFVFGWVASKSIHSPFNSQLAETAGR